MTDTNNQYDDPEQNYCDNCWREISATECCYGEGFCYDCAMVNSEMEDL